MSKQDENLSNSDFDKLLAKEDNGSRAKFSLKFKSFLKSFDLLLKTARKLTDIRDENRNLLEKLSNSLHRRYTFKQLKKQTFVCINDLINASALVDEQYVFSRFQRTGDLLKKVLNSWDIMLHSIEVFAKNPKVCTNLPDEIKLFHDIASTDLEEYLEEFKIIKEEIMLRIPFCQLCNDEECNLRIIRRSGLFDLKELRFDRLIQADQRQIYCGLEKRDSAVGKQAVNKKRTNYVRESQEVKRAKSFEEEESQSNKMKSNFEISNPSCVSNDMAETGSLCDTIFRETFADKKSYIEAWAENQSKNNAPCDDSLQINSIMSYSTGNVREDDSVTQISSVETLPFPLKYESTACSLCCKGNCDGSVCIMYKEGPVGRSDKLIMGAECVKMNIPVDKKMQKESGCCQKTDLFIINQIDRVDPHSMNINMAKEDVVLNRDVFRSPEPEMRRISIPRQFVKTSNENIICIKTNKIGKAEAAKNLEHGKYNLSKSEPSLFSPLKITLVRVGCYDWAVKQNEVPIEGRLRKDDTFRQATLHDLDEKAVERMEILNRVKQALAHEKSSRTIRIKLKSTKRFKTLKQKAVTLCAMKSKIIGRKKG